MSKPLVGYLDPFLYQVFDDIRNGEKERPQVVAFVHGETSTGAIQAPEAITRLAHEVGALVIADRVTTLGSVPIRVDEAGIDIAYSCTQKGLSAPPGLSPFTVSPRASERLTKLNTPRVPEGVDDAKVRKQLLDEHRIEIAGGRPAGEEGLPYRSNGSPCRRAEARSILRGLRQMPGRPRNRLSVLQEDRSTF